MYYKITLLVLCIVTSCGKKQRNLFTFNPSQKPTCNILTLPTVRNIIVKDHNQQHHISWDSLASDHQLIGYELYIMSKSGIIRRRPHKVLNASENSCIVEIPNYARGYVVRGSFMIDKTPTLGPLSKIIPIESSSVT